MPTLVKAALKVFSRSGGKTAVKEGLKTAKAVKKTSKVPKELKSYVRDLESKSGMKVHSKQKEILAKDLRETKYQKLNKDAYDGHVRQFKGKKDGLISEWEKQTGQNWPRYPENMKDLTGNIHKLAGRKYQAHHINPQHLGGKHEWWNIHPAHKDIHQGGIHGSNSVLNQILKGIAEE